MSLLGRLRLKIKQEGIFSSIWLTIRFVLRKIIGLDWNTAVKLERLLEEPIQEIPTKTKVRILQANENNLEGLKGIVDKEKGLVFQERFNRGKICFIALDDNKVIAYSWISLESEYDPNSGIEIIVNNKEAYLFDDFVLPDYRGQRIQSALIPPRLNYLKSRGFHKGFSLVFKNSPVSLKNTISAGFEPKKTVMVFKIFWIKFHCWTEYTHNS
jgi:GNAT superfamily N-acetyltransferase